MNPHPGKLYHHTPAWVGPAAKFHIRIRVDPAQPTPLTDPRLSEALLAGAKKYHDLGLWWCDLFLLMPDHIHAILAFRTGTMSSTIGRWKQGAARFHKIQWQDGYFDHRLRDTHSAQDKWLYIRRNPVVKGLCQSEDDWPHWWPGLQRPEEQVAPPILTP